MITVSTRVTDEINDKIIAIQKEKGYNSKSEVIQEAINSYINHHDNGCKCDKEETITEPPKKKFFGLFK